MELYKDYLNRIKTIMSESGNKKDFQIRNFSGDSQNYSNFLGNEHENEETFLLPSLRHFASELDLKPNINQKLGLHPDFAHLKNSNNIENHYIISAFIDIKGSTNLFRKYDPYTVHMITNTIQSAAIHTCLIFGGYIHRLQGDGLFVYFGGKNSGKESSVINSLKCTSVFSYFVQNDLKNLFDEQGIEKIYTRIGIDLGHENDVIWAKAGIGEISEVTTCSLHTSLASKMQGHAASNGIVIGSNVRDFIPQYQYLTNPVCHRTKDESDRYIFKIPERNFYYSQFDLNWLAYLKNQEFIVTDLSGKLSLKPKIVDNHSISIPYLKPIASLNKPYCP